MKNKISNKKNKHWKREFADLVDNIGTFLKICPIYYVIINNIYHETLL